MVPSVFLLKCRQESSTAFFFPSPPPSPTPSVRVRIRGASDTRVFFLSHERHTARRSSFCSFFLLFLFCCCCRLLYHAFSLSLFATAIFKMKGCWTCGTFFFLVNVLLSCYSSHLFFYASLPCSPLLLSRNYKQLKGKKSVFSPQQTTNVIQSRESFSCSFPLLHPL